MKHCEETGETPKETIQILGETWENTKGNGRTQFGKQGSITLRESP